MEEKKERKSASILARVWWGIDFFRRLVLNIVFFVILFYVLSFLLRDTRPKVPDSTALVVTPTGTIVEQLRQPELLDPAKAMVGLGGGRETLLKDLLDAIEAGKDDTRVKALVLNLNRMGGAGLTKLQDLGAAIDRFKKTGKKVIAVADNYYRNSYYLAAHADEIYLHQMGMLILEGYGRYRRYYKEGLDKLAVEVKIFRVGKYKSAVEPYSRNSMSEEAKESNLRWLGILWDSYLKDVAAARKIKIEAINDYIDRFNENLKKHKGDTAMTALKAGLVDHVVPRDRVRQRLIELVGEDKKTHSYYRIGYKAYLEALDRDRWGEDETGDVIGVVVAKGSILNGYQPPGTIGGDSTAALLRKARQDKKVKAIVLRVDSGGGSSFASEIIRRELEVARSDGKPVVVSMGAVAASGGYSISMASDEVWAYPTTITGSIGIYGMFPTFQKTMEKYLGVRVDGVGTNKFAGALRTDRAISPEVEEAIRMVIENGYDQFINTVAKARNMTPEQVHEIAQGRVWIGMDAHKLGLVDHLGGFSQALDSAAKLAKLGKDYKVKYFRQKLTSTQEMILNLLSENRTADAVGGNSRQALNPFTGALRVLMQQLKRLSEFNDPHGVYAYCFYDVDF
ncbi:MAG: signal peptide peptidase SppA [Candidatus Aminicenantes bacterium]|nr:signal peptide peptidase SppA [Candidatus Aminicenantes bacterium]NIM80085.1 signal peptide peptidase SppA [Candidatus Aminicenantes bacterium]NIN19427.1 signal peptide peptidase SppA [Candidatus Aminicenantes bacterium]NIN43326.1 signal peptide peptidase SppA [Candidatus Aminicenantes bacterium]NIN86070.1 signal peptide peptidase SppA [Candidatus Aminicenantes bacterium]